MKTKKLVSSILLVISVIFLASSCKKDKDEETIEPTATEQNLKLHIHTQVGNQLADYTSTFAQASGRKFILADFRYYISGIVLIKADGTEFPISGKVLLVKPSVQDYALGMVPVGDYKGIRYTMGIDSATNHSNPTVYSNENPLAIQTPSMHWSWSSGYIFTKVEGMCDTTLAANGPADCPFFFHIGMDMMKRTINFSSSSFTVSGTAEKEIALVFDLKKVLQNIDLRTENSTHTMDNMSLATKFVNNYATASTIE